MKPETQTKAIAGSAAAFIASLVPIIIGLVTKSGYSAGQFSDFSDAAIALGGSLVAALIGWAGVYFAPRNKPIS